MQGIAYRCRHDCNRSLWCLEHKSVSVGLLCPVLFLLSGRPCGTVWASIAGKLLTVLTFQLFSRRGTLFTKVEAPVSREPMPMWEKRAKLIWACRRIWLSSGKNFLLTGSHV